ncbi:MAG: ATP/GTP-binding protein [Chitinophagales bacterium]
MKKLPVVICPLVFFLLLNINPAQAQDHQLIKKWQTDSALKVPESVFYDGMAKLLYVSNIDGAADAKDGKGSVGKVSLDGKIIKTDWVGGLNAPKGLGKFNNKLYAADIDEVVVIDIPSAKVEKRIPVAGASFLNDISVDAKGVIYVSDTKAGTVYRIENGNVSLYADGIMGANGVLAVGDDLYVLGNGILWKFGKDKKMTKVADGMDASTDGIEQVRVNEFIVSCWAGAIYYVKGDGSKQQLLDTRPQKINSADIGYDSKSRMVYVPNFLQNSVTAYELK